MKKRHRALALFMAALLTLNLFPATAFASGSGDSQPDCPICGHIHDEKCNYQKPVEEQPCSHTHDESCGYNTMKAVATKKPQKKSPVSMNVRKRPKIYRQHLKSSLKIPKIYRQHLMIPWNPPKELLKSLPNFRKVLKMFLPPRQNM